MDTARSCQLMGYTVVTMQRIFPLASVSRPALTPTQPILAEECIHTDTTHLTLERHSITTMHTTLNTNTESYIPVVANKSDLCVKVWKPWSMEETSEESIEPKEHFNISNRNTWRHIQQYSYKVKLEISKKCKGGNKHQRYTQDQTLTPKDNFYILHFVLYYLSIFKFKFFIFNIFNIQLTVWSQSKWNIILMNHILCSYVLNII
jgi:hypothetical protein